MSLSNFQYCSKQEHAGLDDHRGARSNRQLVFFFVRVSGAVLNTTAPLCDQNVVFQLMFRFGKKKKKSLFPRNQHGVQFFVVNPGLVKTNSLQASGINPTRGMNIKDGVRGHLFCTCL
jgi:hypothetical protein